MEVEPAKRLCAHTALAHPWLASSMPSTWEIDPSVLLSLERGKLRGPGSVVAFEPAPLGALQAAKPAVCPLRGLGDPLLRYLGCYGGVSPT